MRTAIFVIALVVFLASLLVIAGYYYLHARRSPKRAWDGLLGKLTAVDRNNIALIALDLLEEPENSEPQQRAVQLEPSQIFELIGGVKGIEALEANCAVLIDLACYVQQWYPEALVVAEQLRLNAREIQWHLGRLKGAAQTGNLQRIFPDYAQRAVATYYLMTRNLLALYETADLPGFAQLQGAI